MRVAVIGAGAAGLTAAYQLCKGGANVDVFEAGDGVGGLARSIDLWGQRVDLGPHRFFSKDARVNRLWLEVVGRDYRMVDRITRIYFRHRFYHYPLKPGNALRNMGVLNAVACLGSYLKEKIVPYYPPRENETFEGWVVRRFGRKLFEMFFKSYSEKLWGISCQDLDADFAAQRIKKFSLGEAVKSALGISKGQHKTLVDRFAFPIQGTGIVYERMADYVNQHGGKVHVRTAVKRVLHDEHRVRGLELADGRTEEFDRVISTMPLTLLVRGLGELPTAVQHAVDQLRFRNTILVYLHVDGRDLFPDQWQYIHSPELGTGRVTNFRNWVPELYGDAKTTILALEYWCFDEDAIWTEPDPALIARATKEMESTGLLNGAPVIDGKVFRIRRCYPIYARGYRKHLEPVVDYLRGFERLTPIGRYGAFKYNNQDHSILMGLLAAENILERKTHDLWAVNSDYESYQEAAVITETGLEPEGGAAAPEPVRSSAETQALTPSAR
ncbi:MAG: FAD-dependent oxidoreductase [Gemmataceae bacterium]|nr:FAD-dependent oxidoreductase [Gemmataceae bacterium]